MKKLFGIAALILAFSPLVQAQDSGGALAAHPDARNDRQMESNDRGSAVHHGAKHMRHVKRHHAKRHHQAVHKK